MHYLCFSFAYRSGVSQVSGYIAAAVMLLFAIQGIEHTLRHANPAKDASVLTAIRPDLPIVFESGLTFFEANQFENENLLRRAYYLKNRPAAIRYSHGTLFEDFEPPDRLDPEFHIRAHVADYEKFLAQHPRFLMLTSAEPGYWLVSKLRDDGEQIEKIDDVNVPYRDTKLYLVTVQQK